jgi:lipoprotein-releasing system permease protein
MTAILFIAGRHLWHRKLLNGIAVVGVMFGVLTLVAITGIMRGFQTKFLDTIVKITPHVVITDTELGAPEAAIERLLGRPAAVRLAHAASSDRETRIVRPSETVAAIERIGGVVAAAPVVVGSAVASSRGRELPVELRGIVPVRQDRVTPLGPLVVEGSLARLGGGLDGAMIGAPLAELLGVRIGDTITCASARGERATVQIVALFETRIASIDRGRVYASQRLAQTILGRGDAIDRIEVRLDDPARAPALVV